MTRPLGTPTWIDLGSGDLAASKAFYEGLFGWTFEDSGEEFMHYNMIRCGDSLVGGAMDTSGMPGPDGGPIPSSWTVYLAVDDVEAQTALAQENGAHVIVQPAPVGDAGSFAVVVDPSGAAVGMWQTADLEGYHFTGAPGTPAWFEEMTQDYAKAREFYTKVFGFQLVPMPGGDGEPINHSTNGPIEKATSGICDAAGFIPKEMGSYWRTYFIVEGCDDAVARVKELGGKLLDGPEDSPFGRIATVADPQGASFQLCGASEATPAS